MEMSAVIGQYFRDGRLLAIPRRRAARLAVLDVLANQFGPGMQYTEKSVNSVLGRYYPDFCALRRYLVDEEFMERSDGIYWRAGGSFDVN